MKVNYIMKVVGNLLIILAAGLIVNYFLEVNLLDFKGVVIPSVIYTILLGGLIWLGSSAINIKLDKVINREDKPGENFIVLLVLLIAYCILAYLFVDFIWHIFYRGNPINEFVLPSGKNVLMIIGVTLLIVLSFSSKRFLKDKRDDLLKEEKLKTEIIRLEYETLKNQVNPHFLFNSLNALTEIVSENYDAVLFIKKLSDVYRYVLEQKDREVVELDKEIEFVKAYAYLHEIRFGDCFRLEIDNLPNNKKVIPLSVQMLIENAIKHNIVSEDEPLFVRIYHERECLVVENNLQLRSTVKDSKKIGLENIKQRYSYLTDRVFQTVLTNEQFIVKVPMLNLNN